MRALRRCGSPFLVVASLLASASSAAQTSDPSALPNAQALFELAKKEMADGNYAAACPRLEEAARLVPEGMGVKYTLAGCYQGAGKLASAWTLYSIVAGAAGDEARRRDAEVRAAELRPRLAEMTIVVPDEVRALPGIEVKRNGSTVGPGGSAEHPPVLAQGDGG